LTPGAERGRPRIAISAGDPNGIGPEVALKCALDAAVRRRLDPVLVGHPANLRAHAALLGLEELPCPVIDPDAGKSFDWGLGRVSADAGRVAMQAVEKATRLCLEGECDAMVTAPISKEAIRMAGYAAPGHTEFIAGLCGSAKHIMILVSDDLRVGLVTGHVPLREVADAITVKRVSSRLKSLSDSLRKDFGVVEPRVAVLGLNPHAGDGGVLGREEMEVIRPGMEEAGSVECHGPFPADGFFGNRSYRDFDGVLAMYHDQGLAPFKTIAFGAGVNFTAGLPIVRTSPDHGTAFDIAGQNRARPDSMRAALLLAADITAARHRAAQPVGPSIQSAG
jgi:4-hydroxythreonine-4-phosphate dehydrogenase